MKKRRYSLDIAIIVGAAKTVAILRQSAGSSEPSLLGTVISYVSSKDRGFNSLLPITHRSQVTDTYQFITRHKVSTNSSHVWGIGIISLYLKECPTSTLQE